MEVEQAFRAIAADRAVELHVVGATAPEVFAGLPVKNIIWNEANEIEAICAFDIGIMPLADTVWERASVPISYCKSWRPVDQSLDRRSGRTVQ